jgi:hypothetical protein
MNIDTSTWRTRADYDAWWRENGREFNRMAIATPPKNFEEVTNPEWHRIAEKIEAFLVRMKKAELV